MDEDDDTQVYKDHGDALTIAYQSGYYDGKKAAAPQPPQPEQEPVAWQWLGSAHFRKKLPKNADITAWNPVYSAPQRTEQNFCPRCGNRTQDIHTCTPPQEKNT